MSYETIGVIIGAIGGIALYFFGWKPWWKKRSEDKRQAAIEARMRDLESEPPDTGDSN